MNWDELRNEIGRAIEADPTRTINLISTTLNEADIRCLIVATGSPLGPYPQVESTIGEEDMTSLAVGQALTPLLNRLGVPDSLLMSLAGAAGTAAARVMKSRKPKHSNEKGKNNE